AHAGVAILVLGAAGSGLLHTSTIAGVKPGATFTVGDCTLRFEGMREERRADHTAVQARVVIVDGGAPSRELLPERRVYDNFGDAGRKIGIASGWREDVYLALAGWEAGGSEATFEARLNPLMIWFWIGAGLAGAGGAFALLPRLLPRPRTEIPAAPQGAPGSTPPLPPP